MEYRELKLEESHLILQINAEQMIKRAWREVDGKRQLIDINWLEKELPNGIDWHIRHFEESLKNGGTAFGCFDKDCLIGYAVMDGNIFGNTAHYLLLDQLFISLERRGQGIGRALFNLCCKKAQTQGANKLYICASSAEETIAFYFAIGCTESQEINQALYDNDPNDYQLEFCLTK